MKTYPTRPYLASSPSTEEEQPPQNGLEWAVSFGMAMVPISAFGWIHSRGWTGHVVKAVVASPVGVYGLLALPFCTLAMEKCIYDTCQAAQGIDPNVVTDPNRGGFPSGGSQLPSLSLLPVRRIINFSQPAPVRRPTAQNSS